MRANKLAAFGSAAALILSGAAVASCGAPAPQCDFYVNWVDVHIANYTAACIGGIPQWGTPGFATGWQVAFTSSETLLSANWQSWGTPRWYNPGNSVYFSQDDYLTCMPYQTLWYRPVLGTVIDNGYPMHVSSYGSPRRITCGNGVWWAGPVQTGKNQVVNSVRISQPKPKM